MKYPIHRRNIAQQAQQGTLIVDAPLDGTLTNSLGNQYTVAVVTNMSPTFVADSGRQVYQNTQYGQSAARALRAKQSSSNMLPVGSYVFEFEFNLNSLINGQIIFEHIPSDNMSGAAFYNQGGGLFAFVQNYTASGSVVTSSGSISLQSGIWYKIHFEISANAGSVTVNNQTLTYTVNGVMTYSQPVFGSGLTNWYANPIMGKIKNIKVWKL